MADLSDAECLVRIAAQDAHAFTELLRRYQDRVVNLVYRMLGDWDTALDVAQDAFLRIHQRATTFRPEGNAKSWILTVAVNVARDHLRRKPRIVFLEHFEATAGEGGRGRGTPASHTPPELLEQEELRARVREAVARMAEFPRTVLLLRDFEGLAYDEIAEVLECEIGTVKSRIHRARKQFQEIFEELDAK